MEPYEFIRLYLGNDFNLGSALEHLVQYVRTGSQDTPQLYGAEGFLLQALKYPESISRTNKKPSPDEMDAFLASGMSVTLGLVVMHMTQASNAASHHDRRHYLNSAVRKLQEVIG